MPVNGKRFGSELNEANKRLIARFVEFHRRVSLDLFLEIIELSPVWTGRFRASHRISVDSPNENVAPPLVPRPPWPQRPPKTISAPGTGEALRALIGLRPFAIVFINNSLPYAGRLEHGYSQQAPAGVYNVALTSIEAKYSGFTDRTQL